MTLSLKPQCLGAGHGWICVGGSENGRCAFINIGESTPFSNLTARRSEVDALLPLDLDPDSRMHAQDLITRHGLDAHPPSWRPKVTYHELGTLIVNSISVHKIVGDKSGIRDEIVAVLT